MFYIKKYTNTATADVGGGVAGDIHIDEEIYDSQAAEGILSMLDYLISLGNQESKQTTEDVMSVESYDFDNAYAEYLNDDDNGYDDDIDDEDEEEYYGLSL